MSLCIKNKKVFVAGHNGLAGSAIVRRLKKEDCKVITVEKKKVNLLYRNQINKFFQCEKPEIVINAAGKVENCCQHQLSLRLYSRQYYNPR